MTHVLDRSLGRLDTASVLALATVDARLAATCFVAATAYHSAFSGRRLRITSAFRTEDEQRKLVEEGKSFTMNSHHLDGRAIDWAIIIDNRPVWALSLFTELDAKFMQPAALRVGLDPGDLLWGGHWTTLRDGPHWQLMLPSL